MKRFAEGFALLAILFILPAAAVAQKVEDHNFEIAKNLEIFHEIVTELDRYYVDTISPAKTIETGI